MSGVRTVLTLTLLGGILVPSVGAQETRTEPPDWALNLTVDGSGLAVGHIPRVNGIRINFRDHYLEEINGLNLTLWAPARNREVGGTVRGLALGLAAPTADHLQGLSVGGLAVVASEELSGIGIGGLAVVSEGVARGITVGGLASVSNGSSTGINVGGLATVTEGHSTGLNLGGLAVVAGGGDLTGISLGGLAVVAGQGVARGVNLAGLAVVGSEGVEGLNLAGLAVASESYIRGFSFGGYKVDAAKGGWFAGAIYKVDVEEYEGVSVAAWNQHDSRMRGLSIGLLNRTAELHGVQIGLLNYAGNNENFPWLPLFNAHF